MTAEQMYIYQNSSLFVSNNKSHPMIKNLISDILNEFFELHVNCFKNTIPKN